VLAATTEIESVDISKVKNGTIPLDDLDDLRIFRDTFKNMFATLCSRDPKERIRKARLTKITTATSRWENQAANAVSSPASEPKTHKTNSILSSGRPKTPNQPTISVNPDFSGSSRESTDESNSDILIGSFLEAVLSIVRSEVRRLQWVAEGVQVEIMKQYFI